MNKSFQHLVTFGQHTTNGRVRAQPWPLPGPGAAVAHPRSTKEALTKFSLLLLLCVSSTLADKPPVQQPAPSPESQHTAIIALEKLGGRFVKGRSGQVSAVVLSATIVIDADPAHLKELPDITSVMLNRTAITDKGLTQRKFLLRLRFVILADTRVPPAGIEDLQAALPDCRIFTTRERPAQTPGRGSPRRTPRSVTSYGTETSNRAQLLVLVSVRVKLGFSDEQRNGIDKLLVNWPTREEARKTATHSRQDREHTWAKIQQLLTAEQRNRFDQRELQRSGFRVFIYLSRETADKLRLSFKQRARFRGIYADWERNYELPRRGTKAWDNLLARFLEVLTDEQREQWTDLVGRPFDFIVPPTQRGPRVFQYASPNLGRDATWLLIYPSSKASGSSK
jgi:hypothetical protein